MSPQHYPKTHCRHICMNDSFWSTYDRCLDSIFKVHVSHLIVNWLHKRHVHWIKPDLCSLIVYTQHFFNLWISLTTVRTRLCSQQQLETQRSSSNPRCCSVLTLCVVTSLKCLRLQLQVSYFQYASGRLWAAVSFKSERPGRWKCCEMISAVRNLSMKLIKTNSINSLEVHSVGCYKPQNDLKFD